MKPPRKGRFARRLGSDAQPPEYIWADYDPYVPKSSRWAFYRSKADQRSNIPDLKPIKLRVSLA